MPLKLYYHPLASFCWKALIALYETETRFEPVLVELADPASRSEFLKVWPIGKFPVLLDEERGFTLPESTIIIEYLSEYHAGATQLLPSDRDLARATRFYDRFFDLYVHEPMQKIVTDQLRPPGRNDPHGVEQAKALLGISYDFIETEMRDNGWAVGDCFTLADCAAAPALFYADQALPFRESHSRAAAYLDRLIQRPSFARVLTEAEPYFHNFPLANKPRVDNAMPGRS
jgi:glutathione S-transferase